ncbi:sugar/nucleoside kinase (ribokinase family) [Anseongella ginsenosidimutans]|uniref:Sugar/nucleoside kinase (Ribokinase family) n=1 Tax=Anseongella ginsenosidimutans TaxID=496056 RepID=A0A4R3KQ16_9SPHI|nr:PfkB family carbohydrate kinase [Anseongella ginsenosidimutans]QEC52295.1 sugar kinase [Anseongella ginsenosidimutans]TCS86854.1 sugar/nucleoside kinase (ribokinase family) [Anseongella ginsenosidimutans]
MSLVIIGSVAFDSIETPFGKTGKIVGGAAAYASLAASYFSKEVKIVAVVGDDFPREDIEDFHRHGITTEGLQVKEGEKSFFWAGKYQQDLNTRDTLVTELNVLADFDPVIPESYQDCRHLLLGNLTPSVQRTVIKRLRKRPELIVLDTMNFWMDTALDDLLDVLKMVDLLTINDEEARQLAGEYSLLKAARKIMKMGPRTLVIKKGEHGALLFQENKVFSAPALPLEEVFDPTGAGDVFAGGFTGYLAKTGDISFENMKTAVIYGSAMASFCVEKFGTERIKNLSPGEINARVNQLAELSSFSVSSF